MYLWGNGEHMKDTLTGLDCYEVFLDKLDMAIKEAEDRRIAIVYTDIKHFKYINDTYGYQVGDSLLRDFAIETSMSDSPYEICMARVYSDNFVKAVRLDLDDRSKWTNEEYKEFVYQIQSGTGAEIQGEISEQQTSALHGDSDHRRKQPQPEC